MKNTKKAALAAVAGSMVAFGGCVNWQALLLNAAQTTVIEWVLDNDAIFDLFEDGATGA